MSKDLSPEMIVAAVVANPQLLPEIYRKLGWTHRAELVAAGEAISRELTRQDEVFAACREGRYGRDHVEPRMAGAIHRRSE